jgi:hypothetical protein
MILSFSEAEGWLSEGLFEDQAALHKKIIFMENFVDATYRNSKHAVSAFLLANTVFTFHTAGDGIQCLANPSFGDDLVLTDILSSASPNTGKEWIDQDEENKFEE